MYITTYAVDVGANCIRPAVRVQYNTHIILSIGLHLHPGRMQYAPTIHLRKPWI